MKSTEYPRREEDENKKILPKELSVIYLKKRKIANGFIFAVERVSSSVLVGRG